MRLLLWNVERFSFNKISPVARANYMRQVVFPAVAANHADIVAIVEVSAKGRPLGSLVANAGQAGTNLLQFRLNFGLPAPGPWRVVPPLSLTTGGRAEAVGVFYNSNVLNFQGPNNWTAAGSMPGGVPVNYPGVWHVVGGGTQLAGRYAFTTAAGAAIDFPTPAHRRPWMVTFQEAAGAGRTFNFFFVHTSPHPVANAIAAIQNLSNVPEISGAPAAGTVNVVAGDFNIDAIFGGNYMPAYGALIANGYTPLIAQGAGAPSTLLAKRKSARPPVPGVVPPAPRYWRQLSIDNVLVKYGAPPPALPAVDVYDPVAGTPAPPYVTTMAMSLANLNINHPAPPPPNVARYTVFRAAQNFGHIRALSDHLALVVDF